MSSGWFVDPFSSFNHCNQPNGDSTWLLLFFFYSLILLVDLFFTFFSNCFHFVLTYSIIEWWAIVYIELIVLCHHCSLVTSLRPQLKIERPVLKRWSIYGFLFSFVPDNKKFLLRFCSANWKNKQILIS